MSVEWVREKTRAKIGNCQVVIEHEEDAATFWSWSVNSPNGVAQGGCKSFELAQERATKIAECFNEG
jgi:hypothetical protein